LRKVVRDNLNFLTRQLNSDFSNQSSMLALIDDLIWLWWIGSIQSLLWNCSCGLGAPVGITEILFDVVAMTKRHFSVVGRKTTGW